MLKAGEVVDGTVREFVPVGLIAEHAGYRFLIMKHEFCWEPVGELSDCVELGDPITFMVLRDVKSAPPMLNAGSCRRADVRPNQWKPKPLHQLQLLGPMTDVLLSRDTGAAREFVASQDPVLAFHALFEVATCGLSRENLLAANILLERNHPCPSSPVDVVRDIAMSEWNVSHKSLPWYVARYFGVEATLSAVEQVQREALSLGQWVLLDTVKYWVQRVPAHW